MNHLQLAPSEAPEASTDPVTRIPAPPAIAPDELLAKSHYALGLVLEQRGREWEAAYAFADCLHALAPHGRVETLIDLLDPELVQIAQRCLWRLDAILQHLGEDSHKHVGGIARQIAYRLEGHSPSKDRGPVCIRLPDASRSPYVVL